jgi:daunorubicin resistance ABC transporter ATP-binding subunit
MTTEHAIEISGLTKSYGDHAVLTGVDLSVPTGTICALLGSNGAGKTTVVRILSTLLRADGGAASVDGHDVATAPAQVRQSISLTGQFAAVDEILTGRENLVLVAQLRRLRDPGRIADDLLARFALTDAAGQRAGTYSGGMRRRLDIAMSLIGDPPVLFLDEPTTGLDPQSRLEVWRTVQALAGQGTTVLLTTQYLDEADALADEITVIDQGKVIAHDTPSGLKQVVGGKTLEAEPADPSRIAEVTAILRGAAGAEPELVKRGAAAVAVQDESTMPRVVVQLDAAGIAVTELSLHLPSLDEVFFSLTGRRGSDDASRATDPTTEKSAA